MCGTQKMQDEMMDLVDYSSEIQETLGRSYNVPDDLDEEELMGGESAFSTSSSAFECFLFICTILTESLFPLYTP
jgi:hypothetical protein